MQYVLSAEVTIQAKSHYNSFAPGIEICLYHLDLCDAEPSLIFCYKFTRKMSVLSLCLFQVIVESIIIQCPYMTIRSCLLLCLTHKRISSAHLRGNPGGRLKQSPIKVLCALRFCSFFSGYSSWSYSNHIIMISIPSSSLTYRLYFVTVTQS